VPRTELVAEVERARAAVAAGLAAIDGDALDADFPETIAESRIRTGEYLVHLSVHFAYHLGQLDSHRRIVTGNHEGVGALRPVELGSARPDSPSS
jgi:hypothetical protein